MTDNPSETKEGGAPPAVPTSTKDEEKQEDNTSPLYEGEKEDMWPAKGGRRTSSLRMGPGKDQENRQDHMQLLMRQKRASMRYVKQEIYKDTSTAISVEAPSLQGILTDSKKKELAQDAMGLKEAAQVIMKLQSYYPSDATNQVGVRLKDFSYEVDVDPNSNQVQTVFNQSFAYDALKWWKIFTGKETKPVKQRKFVLQNINLNFQPGKMYLILGPPLSGKTSLLKAIAGRLSMENGETVTGSVEYNGLSMHVRVLYGILFVNMLYSLTYSPNLYFAGHGRTLCEQYDCFYWPE